MKASENKSVGRILKQIREGVGLTQDELANLMGKSQSFVSKTESGERSLYAYELFSYSDALGISPYEVVRMWSIELDKQADASSRATYVLVRTKAGSG